MENTTLVSKTESTTNIRYLHYEAKLLPFTLSFQRSTPTMETAYPGCLQIIREAFKKQNLEDSAVNIIEKSISKSTKKNNTIQPIKNGGLFVTEINLKYLTQILKQ